MGLAERFKNKLENRDIYEKNVIEQKLEEKDIKFISKPSEDKIEQKNTTIQSPVEISNILKEQDNTTAPDIKKSNLEDLETEIIDKIRKTPYWEEYSVEAQTNMIEKYFNARIKSTKYSTAEYSHRDKQLFIRTVLALSNNR